MPYLGAHRQIAQALGVSHPTVSAQRRELEENGDVERFTTSTDTLGREQPRTRKPSAPTQKQQATDIDIFQHGDGDIDSLRPCPDQS